MTVLDATMDQKESGMCGAVMILDSDGIIDLNSASPKRAAFLGPPIRLSTAELDSGIVMNSKPCIPIVLAVTYKGRKLASSDFRQ